MLWMADPPPPSQGCPQGSGAGEGAGPSKERQRGLPLAVEALHVRPWGGGKAAQWTSAK